MSRRSKYSHNDLKFIGESIENLKNPEDYREIFDILMKDPSSFCTENSNGTFLNLSAVTDRTLKRVEKYLRHVSMNRNNEIDVDNNILPTSENYQSERSYKLSNYEKNILKQRRIKMMNDEEEFEELTFDRRESPKTSKTTKSKIPKTDRSIKSTKTTKTTKASKNRIKRSTDL